MPICDEHTYVAQTPIYTVDRNVMTIGRGEYSSPLPILCARRIHQRSQLHADLDQQKHIEDSVPVYPMMSDMPGKDIRDQHDGE